MMRVDGFIHPQPPVSANHTSKTASRRAPGRLELAWLTMQYHRQAIAWGGGLLTLTLGLAVVGILRTITVGEPIEHTATVVSIPSSTSIHVEVELGNGSRVMVSRGDHVELLVGEVVAVTETRSGLGTTGLQLSEVVLD